jgi:hypothetical protein
MISKRKRIKNRYFFAITLVFRSKVRYYSGERQLMLDFIFVIIAILLRLSSGAHYLLATISGRVQPNPITWLFWGIAPLVAFLAQVHHITSSTWVTLALAVGPLSIFAATLCTNRQKRWKISAFDLGCGIFAIAGITFWQITDSPLVAIAFGICADIAGGIPTVQKAYRHPHTEHALPYFLTILSMVLTLLSLGAWNSIDYAFPMYILGINCLLFSLIASSNLMATISQNYLRRFFMRTFPWSLLSPAEVCT